jgi:hypothetical protein
VVDLRSKTHRFYFQFRCNKKTYASVFMIY